MIYFFFFMLHYWIEQRHCISNIAVLISFRIIIITTNMLKLWSLKNLVSNNFSHEKTYLQKKWSDDPQQCVLNESNITLNCYIKNHTLDDPIRSWYYILNCLTSNGWVNIFIFNVTYKDHYIESALKGKQTVYTN